MRQSNLDMHRLRKNVYIWLSKIVSIEQMLYPGRVFGSWASAGSRTTSAWCRRLPEKPNSASTWTRRRTAAGGRCTGRWRIQFRGVRFSGVDENFEDKGLSLGPIRPTRYIRCCHLIQDSLFWPLDQTKIQQATSRNNLQADEPLCRMLRYSTSNAIVVLVLISSLSRYKS